MKLNISSSPEIPLFKAISEAILIHKSTNVLILLCGGSTVKFYQYFADKFDSFLALAKEVDVKDFSNLTFGLTDDRWFEDAGDERINYNIIKKTGFFDKFEGLGAKTIKMTATSDMYKDSLEYNKNLSEKLSNSFKIMIGGVGPDGHTCGILPQSTEQKFRDMYSKDEISVAVVVDNIHPNRITITPNTIEIMDERYIFMIGEEKKQVLKDLLYSEKSLNLMPAQVYKNLPNVEIYTDISFV